MTNKPAVYLNKLAVVPRQGVKNFLESMVSIQDPILENKLADRLGDIFDLPRVDPEKRYGGTDLALDIFLVDYSTGQNEIGHLDDIPLPFMWRPKIKLRAKLFQINRGKTIKTFKVVEKSTWKEYFSRSFGASRLLRFRRVFTSEDLNVLLNRAGLRLLKQVIDAAYK